MQMKVSGYLPNYRTKRMPQTMFKTGRTAATESGEGKVLSLVPRLARSWTVVSEDRVIYLYRATDAQWKRNPDPRITITRLRRTFRSRHGSGIRMRQAAILTNCE